MKAHRADSWPVIIQLFDLDLLVMNKLTFFFNTFCQALDSGKEVRTVFCDISKTFDRVWHRGLIHKFRAAGVTGEVLAWFKNQRTSGPLNAHLIYLPSKAQNLQNLENIW